MLFKCSYLRTGNKQYGGGFENHRRDNDACILLHNNLKNYFVFKYMLIKNLKVLGNFLRLLDFQEISFLLGAYSGYTLKFTSSLPSTTIFLPTPAPHPINLLCF